MYEVYEYNFKPTKLLIIKASTRWTENNFFSEISEQVKNLFCTFFFFFKFSLQYAINFEFCQTMNKYVIIIKYEVSFKLLWFVTITEQNMKRKKAYNCIKIRVLVVKST